MESSKPKSTELRLGQLNLNLLTALDALLQERHVTRAAERAGMSQPAMSRALSRLRLILQDPLLVRVANTLYLTSLAQDIAGPVHGIIENIHRVVEYRPSFYPAADRRVFEVAATDYSAYLLLRPLAAHLAEEAPRTTLKVRQLHPESFSELQRGELDILLGRKPAEVDVPNEVVLRDRWMGAVWKGHPDVGETITLEQFLSLPHLAHQLGSGLRPTSDVALEVATGRSQENSVAIESFFLLPFFLRGTRFVTLLPELIGLQIGGAAEMRLLEPPFHIPPILLQMSWPPQSQDDPGHAWLRERIREIGAGTA